MKKIMFNDRYGLTQAVIEGRKTMTRRSIPQSLIDSWDEFVSDAPSVGGVYVHESEKDFYEREAPRYKVGEIVAVAQNYEQIGIHPEYPIAGSHARELAGWNNKMFVKANRMPHHIRITGIRCERLQDISDEDCMNEGVMRLPDFGNMKCALPFYSGASSNQGGFYKTPREAFASLIDNVSGRGTWKRNPWVVVYDFELVK